MEGGKKIDLYTKEGKQFVRLPATEQEALFKCLGRVAAAARRKSRPATAPKRAVSHSARAIINQEHLNLRSRDPNYDYHRFKAYQASLPFAKREDPLVHHPPTPNANAQRALNRRAPNAEAKRVRNNEIKQLNPNDPADMKLIQEHYAQQYAQQHPQQPQPEAKAAPPLPPRPGRVLGRGHSFNGLYDSQIQEALAKTHQFVGTFAIDQVHEVPISATHDTAFILNRDKHDMPGSHWFAVWCSPKKDKDVEIYDSLLDDDDPSYTLPPSLIPDLRKKIDELHLPYRLKLKVSGVRDQRVNSKTCGLFAINFVLSKARGETFAQATHYDSIPAAEKEVRKIGKEFKFL